MYKYISGEINTNEIKGPGDRVVLYSHHITLFYFIILP